MSDCVSLCQSELQRELEHKNSMQVVRFLYGLFLHKILNSGLLIFILSLHKAAMNSDIHYTADTFLFSQIPTVTENNGYSYSGNPATSMSHVSIVYIDNAVQLVGLFIFC